MVLAVSGVSPKPFLVAAVTLKVYRVHSVRSVTLYSVVVLSTVTLPVPPESRLHSIKYSVMRPLGVSGGSHDTMMDESLRAIALVADGGPGPVVTKNLIY